MELRTWKDWKSMDRFVTKGSKAVSFTEDGLALFSVSQVLKMNPYKEPGGVQSNDPDIDGRGQKYSEYSDAEMFALARRSPELYFDTAKGSSRFGSHAAYDIACKLVWKNEK